MPRFFAMGEEWIAYEKTVFAAVGFAASVGGLPGCPGGGRSRRDPRPRGARGHRAKSRRSLCACIGYRPCGRRLDADPVFRHAGRRGTYDTQSARDRDAGQPDNLRRQRQALHLLLCRAVLRAHRRADLRPEPARRVCRDRKQRQCLCRPARGLYRGQHGQKLQRVGACPHGHLRDRRRDRRHRGLWLRQLS